MRVPDYAALLVTLAALAVLVWLVVERVAAGRLALRARCVVNLHSGHAVTGVLWRRCGRLLVLRSAELLEPGARTPTVMDGEVVVDRDQVLMLQKLGA